MRATILQRALLSAAIASAATSVVLAQSTDGQPVQAIVSQEFQRRGVIGYADKLSAQPGDTIRFMVSSELPRYRADIVRLIHGDANTTGPGIKEILVDSPVNMEYPGKRQPLPFGSYVEVPDAPALSMTGSFTITAWIAPTTPGRSAGAKAAQGVLTKWADRDQRGCGLFVDEEGRLAVWLGSGQGHVEKVSSGVPLRAWASTIPGAERPRPQYVTTTWYFVAASFDAASKKVRLYQEPLNGFPDDPTHITAEQSVPASSIGSTTAPLLMAAYAAPRGGPPSGVAGLFNGKIDGPRLYGRALTDAEVRAVEDGRPPADAIGAWDFSIGVDSTKVSDTTTHKLDGRTVNVPMRAVTGHNWRAVEMDFRHAPAEYGAIYFHDDDLEDARWETGFTLTVPAGLASGVYAARLRTTTGEDYVPFFVRPPAGTATAKIALLIPTFSYLAYAGSGQNGFRPLSLYSAHNDGSGVVYSSHLRPITNMRPKIATNNPWQFMADTHLVDWLYVKGFQVDVITDHDLHAEGAGLLQPYKVVLTGTHPEYYSQQMLDAFQTYLQRGGRAMYMGGNGFYWVTTLDASGRFIEVRRRDGTEAWQGAPGESHHSTTGEAGGLWRFRGRAPQQIFGVGFTAQGFDRNSPYRRMPGSFEPRAKFIFEGIGRDELIGNHPSLVLTFGAAGSELDRLDYALGSPPHTLVLATSFGHSDAYQHVVEEVNTSNSRQGGTVNALVKADMTYAEYPNGGAVFSTASIAWSGSLSFNNYDNNVSRITENVLRRFMSDEPIPFPGRVSN